MRRSELWSILLAVVLTSCSLPVTNSVVRSSTPLNRDAQSDGSSIKVRTLYSFGYHANDGVKPESAFSAIESCTSTCREDLYGTTAAGGSNNAGTIYDVYTGDVSLGYFDENVVMNFSPASTGSDPMSSVLVGERHGRPKFLFATASQGGPHGKGTIVTAAGDMLAFDGRNGAVPTSGLTALNPKGFNSYTTTLKGGAHGLGTILAISFFNNRFTSRVLYSFGASGAAHPNSALDLVWGSAYYGTTSGSKNVPATVYEFMPAQSTRPVTTLYSFQSSTDGSEPTGVNGEYTKSGPAALFGTTVKGGVSGYGTLYELNPSGSTYTLVKLHDFGGGSTDGAYPQGAPAYYYYTLHFNVLLGVTSGGGAHNCGTIFSYDLPSSQYAVIYSFTCKKDGGHPLAGLAAGADGFVGTTSAGGMYHDGTVFTFKPL